MNQQRLKHWANAEVYEAYKAETKRHFKLDADRMFAYEKVGIGIYKGLVERLGLEQLASSALLPLIIDDVRRMAELRCIENANESQGELFGEEFLDSFVKVDEHSFMPIRYATIGVLNEADRRKFKNVRIANDSYARWRERYDKLRVEGGMEANATLIVEDAVKKIKSICGWRKETTLAKSQVIDV